MYTGEREYSVFLNRLQQGLAEGSQFSVVLLDIDRFHHVMTQMSVNERVSAIHSFFAEVVSNELFYLGRDEFGMLCADKRSEDVLVELIQVKQLMQQQFQTTFSAGVAECPKAGDDYTEVIRTLEEAVHEAKKEGRNRIVLASDHKMKLKSNYYTPTQLDRLQQLAQQLQRSEASLLRESLDLLFRKYER